MQPEVHTNSGTANEKAIEKENLILSQTDLAIHPTTGFSISMLVKPVQPGFFDVAKNVFDLLFSEDTFTCGFLG